MNSAQSTTCTGTVHLPSLSHLELRGHFLGEALTGGPLKWVTPPFSPRLVSFCTCLFVCYYFTVLILLFYFTVIAMPIDNKGLPVFVEILGIIGLL